ncbi:MAG: YceI family protein [Phycisphaeraceae bacterium]|nr:YceI family protein [Phycisphaerae bacterium]MBX3393317.1 YceI family protein [Phycisphaeraceae bacterium]HRJ50662.1 YceI family protein [Phycisphaerales bacterium]
MHRRAFGVVGVAAAIVAGSALALAYSSGSSADGGPVSASPAASPTFKVDAVHSSVLYRIKHLNAAWSYGRFNDISGTFNIDDGGAIDVTVKTASVDSANAKRDGHLQSPDFFSAKEFPEITFKSTSMTRTGDDTFEARGPLTLRGVTRDVTVSIEKTGEGPGQRGQGKVQGFEARFTIKRTDFGINYMVGPLGDEVTLIVSLEGNA